MPKFKEIPCRSSFLKYSSICADGTGVPPSPAIATLALVDLTAAGTLDWTHYGYPDSGDEETAAPAEETAAPAEAPKS